jgi:hypothetical protein
MEGKGLGINYSALDKAKFIMIIFTQVGEMYTPVSGKFRFCTKNDGSKSRACECRKMSKFCPLVCLG